MHSWPLRVEQVFPGLAVLRRTTPVAALLLLLFVAGLERLFVPRYLLSDFDDLIDRIFGFVAFLQRDSPMVCAASSQLKNAEKHPDGCRSFVLERGCASILSFFLGMQNCAYFEPLIQQRSASRHCSLPPPAGI